jgi:hypothetical protein
MNLTLNPRNKDDLTDTSNCESFPTKFASVNKITKFALIHTPPPVDKNSKHDSCVPPNQVTSPNG